MFLLLGAQKSMYFFEKLNPGTSTYHHTVAMDLKGKLDINRLKSALKILAGRHDVLRSYIAENDAGDAFLDIAPEDPLRDQPLTLIESNLANIPDVQDLPDTLNKLNHNEILHAPFDFEREPLWRTALVKVDEDHYQLVFVIHHILVDVGSQNILLRDLSEIYNSLDEERQPDLPFIANLSTLTPLKKNRDEQIKFWQEELEDLSSSSLLSDLTPQTRFRFKGDRVPFHLSEDLMQQLKKLAETKNVSVNSILLSALYALFYRYTEEQDVCFGYVSANRRGYNVNPENYVNCFINSIPLRIKLDKDQPFDHLAQKVAERAKNVLKNQLPLDEVLQEAVSAKTKASATIATPFSILCNFNAPKTPLDFNGVTASHPIELNLKHSKFQNFGINFNELISENNNSIGAYDGFIEYNTDLFKHETIKGFAEHFEVILKNIVENPHCNIADLPLLTPEEVKLLDAAHENKAPTPLEYIPEIFSDVAAEKQNKTAVFFHREDGGVDTLSYEDLEKKTDDLAAYLMNLGVGPEVTVGVSLNRSLNLIIAILAILKTGGVIVPLDDGNPDVKNKQENKLHKITDAKVKTIIIDDKTSGAFEGLDPSIVKFNIDDPSYLNYNRSLNLTYKPPQIDPHNLAYIMYTSGSTGTPKGVMIEHLSLANLYHAIKDRGLPPEAKILLTAPATFDCFYFEILEWLATKGELHFINARQRLSPSKQEEIINQYGIQTVTLLPEVLINLEPEKLPSLIDVISMGEAAQLEILERWYKAGKVIRNEYGPTETTICATENPYNPNKSAINIGPPVRNLQIYVLDKNFHECPVNVPGQLYIGGLGVARGYLGDAKLNEENFPVLAFDPETRSLKPVKTMADVSPEQYLDGPPQTVYSSGQKEQPTKQPKIVTARLPSEAPQKFFPTGDFGKYFKEPDGKISIEFLGRRDRRIKLHGVRIELTGLEALIRKHPAVKDVYIKLDDTKSALIYYVVPEAGKQFEKAALDAYLREAAVPPVAWPKNMLVLDCFELTKNGKIDVKNLPAPFISKENIQSAQTHLQSLLCKIWSEILHIPNIDITQTFIEQGGDSLGLAILETALNHKFKLSARIGFNILNNGPNNSPTILQLESLIEPFLIDKKTPLNQPKEKLPVTPGITFFGNLKNNSLTLKRLQANNHKQGGFVRKF